MRNTTAAITLCLLLLSACARGTASSDQPEAFSVVTLNIWHDQQDWPTRLAHIVQELRALEPDVIGLQEVLQKPGLPNQAETLADSLGYHVYFSSVDGPDQPKRYGNAILTRYPVLADGWKALDPAADYRTIAHVRVEVAGRPVDVYATHLHHTPEGSAIRQTQVEDALAFIDDTRGDGPAIFLGDFNAVPDAPELGSIDAAFADAYAAVHPEAVGGGPATLNVHLGHTARRIDHIFFERDAGIQPVAAEVLFDEPLPGGAWASDHFGVYSRFTLTCE